MSAPEGRSTDKPRLTQRASYRWVVLGMGFLGVFGGVGLGRFAYSAILPSMQRGLQISSASADALASWNFGGYLLMAAAVCLSASLLAVFLREARLHPRSR